MIVDKFAKVAGGGKSSNLSKATVVLGVMFMGVAAYAEDIGVTRADNGDITVAPGGEVTVGPTASSTNNSGYVTITFENGGTIKATPFNQSGQEQNIFYMWRDYIVNGDVTFDGSDLGSAVIPEFRRSIIATNGTLKVSADRSTLKLGSGEPNRARNYPFYDVTKIEFLSGSGTIELTDNATLADVPPASSGITLKPNGAKLGIAGRNIVSNYTNWATKRVSFSEYGWLVHLLDESYIPEGVTVAVSSGHSFRIQPSEIAVTNGIYDSGDNAARVFWRPKEGTGVAPFDIDMNGGRLDLETPRSTYEFTGKIYGRGTINFRGRSTSRTIDEIEGSFNFTNDTYGAGTTIVVKKVNPGSRLRYGGNVKVNLVFEEGALPGNATMSTFGLDKYVFVPAADGSIDTSGIPSQRATDVYLPFGEDATVAAGDCQVKIGVTNNATVSLVFDTMNVPTVVGGEGTFAVVSTADFPHDWPALWMDASKPYDTAAKGAPYYAPPAINLSEEAGYNFGNFFFTNGYPFVEAWYDVRGVERSWRLYNGRFYSNNDHKLYTHVYPYLASFTKADGTSMHYMSFGEWNVVNQTWSKDGPDTPATVLANMGGNRRLDLVGRPSDSVKTIVMVFGSQQGGGIAMLGGGYFTRNGRTLSDTVCKTAPANTTIWIDGEQIDPMTTYFNGGWQVVTVTGVGAAGVNIVGQDTNYQDAGGQNYGEILFFTNTVTDLQRQQVEAYLAEKWGVATYKGATMNALRAEGRTGAIAVQGGVKIELRGTFAGNLTVDGKVSIAESLPWSADDVPTTGLVDWYDADDTNSLKLMSYGGADNAVTRQYPRGKSQSTATSGYSLYSSGSRMPFAVKCARGLGAERTWIDYNHPDGFAPGASDGNVMRFLPYNQTDYNKAVSQSLRTLLVALDSSKGGGTIIGSAVGGTSGDFRKRGNNPSFSDPIWENNCAAAIKNGVTRLNGAAVDQTKGLTGAPEVLSLTAMDDVSALCVDAYISTESQNGTSLRSYGIIHGEMLMYDSELDADVLANIEAYLMKKWTGVLPDGWTDLREATVTGGTGTVSTAFAKLPAFGDGFTGTISMPDDAFTFTYDGSAEDAVPDAFVARGATIDLPAAVTVTVNCSNVRGVASVPLFDVAGFANPVTWTPVVNGADGKSLRLREENGKLLLEVIPTGLTIIVR